MSTRSILSTTIDVHPGPGQLVLSLNAALTRHEPRQAHSTLQRLSRKNHFDFSYHAYTLWVFNVNDLKTIVLPCTSFAVMAGIRLLRQQLESPPTGNLGVVPMLTGRIPLALIWTWVNLLGITIPNQMTSRAIGEDKLNKPWRPIPAGRMTQSTAQTIALFVPLLACALSFLFGGGLTQSILLTILGFVYNIAGGDQHWFSRNLINACGITSFNAGALEIILQSRVHQTELAWLAICAGVVFTTIHMMDMYDQVGDCAAGRQTMPLVLGDGFARYTIACAVIFWSCAAPGFWNATASGHLMPIVLGAVVVTRVLAKRRVKEDKDTAKIYFGWVVSLYALPFMVS